MRLSVVATAALATMLGSPAIADTPAQNAIQAVLDAFVENFNQGNAGKVCDIFSTDLIYDYRGLSPNRTYDDVCDGLHKTLGDKSRRFEYGLDRREMLVFGDVAAVRVVWNLHLQNAGSEKVATVQEYSLDLFRKEAGGVWKLFRFNAFDAE